MALRQKDVVVALTGNVGLEHPVSQSTDEGFLELVTLLRSADLTVTSMECTIHDGRDWPAYMAGSGWMATYMGFPPRMISELRWMGIDACLMASNHAADFGENGVVHTIEYLEKYGMPFAGIGRSLTEASMPCYVDTPSGLRVGIISAVDWGPRGKMDLPMPLPMGFMPSDDRPPFRPRPGVNLLRFDAVYHVDRATFTELRRASAYLGWDEAKATRRSGGGRDQPLIGPHMIGWETDTDTEVFFGGRKFVLSDEPGTSTFCYEEDRARIYRQVREARRQADIVVVALHDQSHGERVWEYIESFTHGAVDAGADICVNTGGYQRGIEIYNGKAILYGQPGLLLQNEQVTRVPSSSMPLLGLSPDVTPGEFFEERMRIGKASGGSDVPGTNPALGPPGVSSVGLVVFDRETRIKAVRVQPFEFLTSPRHRRNFPFMPRQGSEAAQALLAFTAERCKPFGTTLEIREGIGTVVVS
jgi:poly-gamma-glutamate capsule biosynthesis protein CapA/YwtB (metallophosphatase superfamily)